MLIPQAMLPKLYTYQDLADYFQVHAKTVSRWFNKRKVFRPNHSTVRITQEQLDAFIVQSGRQPKKKA